MSSPTRRPWRAGVTLLLVAVAVTVYATLDQTNTVVDEVVLQVAAAGQVLFVILWATQRWWSSRVGQALMGKSAALAAVLAASVWALYMGPLPVWIGRALFGLVTAAILGQLYALAKEIRAARAERRHVSGLS